MKDEFMKSKTAFDFRKCAMVYNQLNNKMVDANTIEKWLDELFEYMIDSNLKKVCGGWCWEIEKNNHFFTISFVPFSFSLYINEG